jgi:hypothetical protein
MLPQLLTMTLCGGAAAGLATLWLRDRRSRRAAAAFVALTGAFVATSYTVAQAAGATRQLGTDFDGNDRVLAGVIAVAVAGSVAGTALGLFVALGGPVMRALAAAPLSIAAASWFDAVALAVLGLDAARPLLSWSPYVVGALVGLALAGLGLRPARRLVWWPVVLVLVGVCQALLTAIVYVTPQLRPGAGLPSSLGDLRDAFRDVFLLALRPEHQPWAVYVVALAGGLAGGLVLWRRPDSPDTPDTPSRQGPAVATVASGTEPAGRHTGAAGSERPLPGSDSLVGTDLRTG